MLKPAKVNSQKLSQYYLVEKCAFSTKLNEQSESLALEGWCLNNATQALTYAADD